MREYKYKVENAGKTPDFFFKDNQEKGNPYKTICIVQGGQFLRPQNFTADILYINDIYMPNLAPMAHIYGTLLSSQQAYVAFKNSLTLFLNYTNCLIMFFSHKLIYKICKRHANFKGDTSL